MLKRQLLNSLRWPIHVIKSVDNTKLHGYTLPPTQHQSFFRNLPLYSLGSGELLFTLKNAKQMLNFLTKRTVNKLLPDLNNIT